MDRNTAEQKKKVTLNYVYATLIGMLVVACAIAIAMLNTEAVDTQVNVGGGEVNVSANTYVVPMKNATVQKDYSGTELQYNESLKQWEIHKAIDFLAGEDTQVMAVANGVVSKVYSNYLEGGVVEITHSNGLVSIYKSLAEEINVAVGDSISAGDVIGMAGNTMSQELNSGKHLHFEMLLNGVKVDPNNYIPLGNK